MISFNNKTKGLTPTPILVSFRFFKNIFSIKPTELQNPSSKHFPVAKPKAIPKLVRGFTLMEMLIAIGIVLLILGLSFFSLKDYIKRERINNEVRVLVSFLQEARSKTLSAKDSSQYGVRTETNQIILFKGSAYSAGDPNNSVHDMDSSVYLSIGGGLDTVFKRITGEVVGLTEPRYIIIYTTDASLERTIVIHPSGLIENLND